MKFRVFNFESSWCRFSKANADCVFSASSLRFSLLKMSSQAAKQIYYSEKYTDDEYEYRHVMLPKEITKLVPKSHLMSETEWRGIGVQQSQGWVHYMKHDPEPHILLFRRKLATSQQAES